MGITTVKAKKTYIFLFLSLLLGAVQAVAQCPTVADNTQSFCDLQSPTVSSLVATNNGGGVVWYADAVGGSPLSGATGLINGEDYWVDSTAGCGSRVQVTVTIYSAPTGLSFQGVCVGVAGDAQINDLIATGNNVQWYTSPAGGTPLPGTTQLVDSTIYYASQTNPDTGCETSRLSVFVNVGVVPTPTGPPIQQFCNTSSPTIADLAASGVNNWYPTSSSAVVLPASTPLVNGQSYFATTVDPPCESQSRLEVLVQLLPPNNSGTSGARNICANQVSTTPPFNLFPLLGGTPQSGGTWTGSIATTNGSLGTLNPSTMTLGGSPYVFTYTVNNGVCAASSSTVTVNILPSPTAAISGNTTICSGGNATVTFTGTPNATVTYTITGTPGNQTIVLNGSGTATLTGSYTSNTTVALVSVASAGTPSCSQVVTGSVTINVLPLPTASIASNVSVCSGGSATVTFTGTPNATVTYNTGGGNQTVVLNAAGTATITATYTTTTTFNLVSVTSSGTPACTRALTGSVTVTVVQPPTVTIGTSTSVCPNGSATVTFTGTPNATVTYTVSGVPGNQTIVLNASGTATITTTYTATTIYTLVSVATAGTPVCIAPVTGSATITVLPLPTASISSNTTICSGQGATVTFTGTPNATVTYNTGGPNLTLTLDATGTAQVTNTYTSTTVFTLVSVSSAGTPSCTRPLAGSVTITVLPLPTVSIASNTTVCSGGSATVTFTGTPNATVTYNTGGGNQTIVLNASGTATITSNYTTTTTFNLVSVASAGTPSCSRPVTGSVTITVTPPPTVAISASVTTVCSGGSATVTFTGTPNATVTYNNGSGNQTIVLNAAGTATLTTTFTSTTTFTLFSVATSGTPSCSAPATGSVTINVIPPPTVSIAANATVCSGQSATVTFTGTPNATVTYTVSGTPGNQTIVLNAAGTATITQAFTSTTAYTLVSIATAGTPSCTRPVTGTITITVVPPPTVAISGNATVCSGQNATITFTGTPNATVTYNNGSGNQTIVLNASGTATITQPFTSTTTFTLVSVATSGTPSCNVPAAGSVTITVTPPPTVTIASSTTSVCPGGSATITFTGTPNATVTYNNGSGNQTIVLNASGTATITQNFTSTTTFTLVSVATSGTPSCTAPATGSVTITVLPPPTASISSSTTICSGGTATITFTGTPNATVTYTISGIPGNQFVQLDGSGTVTITNPFTATTTYTLVSVTTSGPSGCVVPATGSITITVLPPPTAAISTNVTVCLGQSATVTFTGTPNATVTYTVTGTPSNQTIVLNGSGTATITANYTATTTYTLVSVATSGTPNCSAPANGSMTVTVVPPPTVSISSDATICTGGTATVIFTGTPNATVTYNTGGPNLTLTLDATGTAQITNTYTSTTVFTLVGIATSGTPSCNAPANGSVTITVVPPPTVTISGNATVCSGQSATVTFTGTPNAIVTYNDGSSNQTIVLNASGTATITQAFTSSTIYTLVSVATSGTPGCSTPATGSVTITVIPPPTVTISGNVTVCSGESATITFTGTPNATVTYNTGGPNLTLILDATGTATITQTFTSTTTFTVIGVATFGTPVCTASADQSITITVVPPPTATISGTQSICSGQNATITFTGTPNATVTYNDGNGNQTIVLDATGSATITQTFTSSTTFTLVGVATSGNPGCSAPATGTATIAVLPAPTVSVSADVTICSGEVATITFTGTPNTTVTYNTGGPNLTLTLDATGTAEVTNTYTSTTVFTLVSVTSAGTPNCTQPVSGTATITVIPPPTVTISASSASTCSGSTVTVTFTGTPNATVTYNDGSGNQTIVLDAAGTATLTPTISATITYTLVGIETGGTPNCSAPATGSVTITAVQPPVAGNDVANFALCATGAPVDLFALLGVSAQPGGTWTPALASGTGIFNPAVDAAGTYTYTVTGTAPCPDDTATVTVSIVAAPNAGQDAVENICTTEPPIDLFTLLGPTAQPGGTWSPAMASGTGVFNPEVDPANTYTYTVAGTSPCGSDSATVIMTVNQGSDAGQNGTVTFCNNEPPQDLFNSLGGTPMPGGIWSPALASGTGVFNPAVDAPGVYTYTTFSDACPEDTATVTVSVTAPSNAGNDAMLSVCSNADQQDLFALLGTSAQTGGTWSPALASGTGIFTPGTDPAGTYTYTVIGTPACGNDSATVTVSVTPGPDAGQNGTLTLCVNSAPQDLFNSLGGTPMPGGTWSPALASGSGIFNPAIDAAGVYTYTFAGNAPCDNDTATVTVTVNPIPDAGTNGTAFFCSNHAPADLFASLGGMPQQGGTWSPALSSGTGVFNPAIDPAGVYTYTVGGNFCSTSTATVTVSVTQAPNAGGAGATLLINACVTATSVDLFTALNGSQDPGGTWTDANNAVVGNIFNPSSVAPGTYTFTYTVTGGTSPCTSDSATVTVNVDPIANAGTFAGSQSVCASAGTFDLMNLLTGAQTGGTWTDASNATITNPLDVSTLAAGTYSYTYTVANSCGNDTESVQLTILPSPSTVIPNTNLVLALCLGQDATVTFPGTPDGNYTLTYDLSGANTASGQTVNVTIAGGMTTFTIPATSLANPGTTTATFTNILSAATNCSSVVSGVVVTMNISAPADLESANLSAVNFCLGNGLTVAIVGAAGMPDGNYTLNYSIPGANPSAGTVAVTIASGSGGFTIPATSFATAGDYTITITGIVSQSGGCGNAGENASANFQVLPVPGAATAAVVVDNTCVGSQTQVNITGITGLPDGNHAVAYVLSGANTAATTVTVTFAGGSGSFVIPASELVNAGSTTLAIQSLMPADGSCGIGNVFPGVAFEVTQLGTPVLVPQGNEFCRSDQPTIAELSANITGIETVVWYDAPTGGTAYATTDLLLDGVTYYAAYVASSGCESAVRLAVTVSLTLCDDIIIPDGFSPNGDNINDAFVIVNLRDLYPNFRLEIYNRYGNILYKGGIDTPDWDGTASQGGLKMGGELPVGVYFFILEFNDGSRKPIQGRVYLSR